MYRALMRFIDLQDNRHVYEAGEPFPRPGLNVTPERLAELSSCNNRMGYPLIEQAIDAQEDAPNKPTRRTAKTAKKAVSAQNKG